MRTVSAAAVTLVLTGCFGPGVRKNTDPIESSPPLVPAPARTLAITPCSPSPASDASGGPAPAVTGYLLKLLEVAGSGGLGVSRYSFVWSSSGKWLIGVRGDTVQLWNTTTGALDRTLSLPGPVEGLMLPTPSPDDRWIAVVAGLKGQTVAWLLSTTGETARRLGPVRGAFFQSTYGFMNPPVRFSADGRRLYSREEIFDLSGDRAPTTYPPGTLAPDARRLLRFVRGPVARWATPELVDLASGRVLHTFPRVHFPESAAFSADGNRLAVVGDALHVFRLDTYEEIMAAPEARGALVVQLTPDGRFALTDTLPCIVPLSTAATDAGSDDTCGPAATDTYDVDRGLRVLHLPLGGARRRLSDDGAFLYGSMLNGVTDVLRVQDQHVLQFGIHTLSVSPDGRRAAYEAADGIGLAALDASAQVPAHVRLPRVVARSGDGLQTVAVAADGVVRLEAPGRCFDLGMAASFGAFRHPGYVPFEEEDDRFDFSSDAATLFVSRRSWDGDGSSVQAIDTRDGTRRWSIRGFAHFHVLPAANLLLAQSGSAAPVTRFDAVTRTELPPSWRAPSVVWMDSGAQIHAFIARDLDGPFAQMPDRLVLSPDGHTLAAVDMLEHEAHLSIWDAATARDVRDVRLGGGVKGEEAWRAQVAVSPDGTVWAATTSNGTVVLIHRAGAVQPIPHGGLVHFVQFTPRGDRLVTATRTRLRVLDVRSGAVLGAATFSDDLVRGLWLSADGDEARVDTERRLRVRFGL